MGYHTFAPCTLQTALARTTHALFNISTHPIPETPASPDRPLLFSSSSSSSSVSINSSQTQSHSKGHHIHHLLDRACTISAKARHVARAHPNCHVFRQSIMVDTKSIRTASNSRSSEAITWYRGIHVMLFVITLTLRKVSVWLCCVRTRYSKIRPDLLVALEEIFEPFDSLDEIRAPAWAHILELRNHGR